MEWDRRKAAQINSYITCHLSFHKLKRVKNKETDS